MERLNMIVAIADRGRGERMAEALSTAGCRLNLLLSGSGTAKSAFAGYLGLCDTHKDVVLSLCPPGRSQAALKAVTAALDGEERHLAMSLPLNSIAGKNVYEALSRGENTDGQSL